MPAFGQLAEHRPEALGEFRDGRSLESMVGQEPSVRGGVLGSL